MPDDEIDPVPKVEDPKAAVQPTETLVPPAPVIEEPKDSEGKVLQVKHSDFKKIKDEAKDKGRREAFDELDGIAREAGYSSYKEFMQAHKKIAAPTPAAPIPPKEVTVMPKQPDPKPPVTAKPAAAARATAAVADERGKMRKQWRREEKLRRETQRQLDAKEAEMGLREEIYKLGVTDVDYALHLLKQEMRVVSNRATAAGGDPVAELGKLDRKAFFDGVRKDRPYLFGERVQPATTGTNGAKPDGSDPKAPPAGQPVVEGAKAQQFDAKSATPQQVQDRLKALGLNPHM
jgi:hypothetical protein